MANLALEIKTLADTYARKLNELHDDYVHTKMLWNSIQFRVLRYNDSVIVQNPVTGSATAGVDLANKAPASLERLNARSFKDIVAQFELFATELLRLWLSEKPTLLAEKAITVATLLASRSLADAQSAAIREAVESMIAGLNVWQARQVVQLSSTEPGRTFRCHGRVVVPRNESSAGCFGTQQWDS